MSKQPRPEGKPLNSDDLLGRPGTSKESFGPDKVRNLRDPGAYKIRAVNAAVIEAPRPSEYLIKGIIEPSQVSIWFGPPGNGKTFLLLHLAYAVARGDQVFGRRVRQADTLYMALEGRGGISKRIYAMYQAMGEAPRFWFAPHELELLQADTRGTTRVNMEHVEGLIAFMTETKIKFLVIDTLNLTLGGAEENDNSVMGMLIKAAGDVAMKTGAHIAFVAHSAKAGIDGGPRGGGAQKGNADLVVSVSGEGVFTASCFAPAGKIKDGAAFKLHFKLKTENLLTDPDGDVMTSCTIEESEAGSETQPGRLNPELQRAYLEICDLFSAPGVGVDIRPQVDMSTQRCVTPAEVNAHWIKTGRVDTEGVKPAAILKQGQRLRKKLRDLGKIGMTDKWVWLVDMVDTGGQ